MAGSNKSSKPTHSQDASEGIKELIQQYEATPEAKKADDKIKEFLGEAAFAASFLNIEVLEEFCLAVGGMCFD